MITQGEDVEISALRKRGWTKPHVSRLEDICRRPFRTLPRLGLRVRIPSSAPKNGKSWWEAEAGSGRLVRWCLAHSSRTG